MNYFFDESGNWSRASVECRKLILGGLFIKDKNTERVLDREFKLLQAENDIKTLHAMDLSPANKEACYRIIANNLSDKDAILIRTYAPETAVSKNAKQAEDVYSDLAADLVNTISFGDDDLNIFYDMKFHYSYPSNVIMQIKGKKPWYYRDMKNKFTLKDEAFFATRSKIERKTGSNLGKGSKWQKEVIANFFEKVTEKKITLNSFDKKAIEKLEEEKNKTKDQIENYLWSELWLKIEGEEIAKEKFRDSIFKNNKEQCKAFEMDDINPRLKLYFADKKDENPGVQVIDFICNLVYRYGTTPPTNCSDAINTIYKNIIIEEM